MAGVALGHMHLCFAWQAWHLWHWAGSGGALGPVLIAVTPRHFAWQAWHLVTSTFFFAWQVWHLAFGHMHLHFACNAWHLWAGSGGALGPVLVASDAAALCVAGVALGDIHLRLAWQAWHLVTGTFLLRGRSGAYGIGLLGPVLVAGDAAALCVAGVALGDIHVLPGRCGTWSHAPSFCVAGVALMALGWLRWRALAGFSRR